MVCMESKSCVACKEVLPLEMFGRDKKQADGLHYYCRSCVNKRVRDYKKRFRADNPLHPIWEGMIGRCTNPHNKDYVRYGARGIKVFPEWLASFEVFRDALPPRPDGATLDRIDNQGNYEPGNVRWSTPKEQAQNRRTNKIVTFNGRSQTVSQWANEIGISRITLAGRLRRMPVEDALTRPVQARLAWTFDGRTMTPSEWATETGISRGTLVARVVGMGWPVEKALTTPVRS